MFKKLLKNSERGQAIVLIAVAFVGLIAMVGLMTDGGMMLIEYARLKRGIDAASIAAAQQFRKDFDAPALENAAENFLKLNQSDSVDVHIYTCDYVDKNGVATEHDASLCTGTRSKLVRVTATRFVQFGFMRVIGINGSTVSATSVGEAASIDLVLIMDTSMSMAYGTSGSPTTGNEAGDDPHACNASHTCQPLENIKTAAQDLIGTLFFPYDRVAIVTMTDQVVNNGNRVPTLALPLSDDYDTVFNALEEVSVYDPPVCVPIRSPVCPPEPAACQGAWTSPVKGPCRNYVGGVYQGSEFPYTRGGADLDMNTDADDFGDPTTIQSSNVGGTFLQANAALTGTGAASREDAFWVVIALIGGPANSTDPVPGYPDGLCPPNTWSGSRPRCRDSDLAPDGITPDITRHDPGDPNAIPPVDPDPDYDADDYARDMADFIANPSTGNGIVIFTIGLGTAAGQPNSIMNAPVGLPTSANNLLAYAARNAGDYLDANNQLVSANHGEYYYAEEPNPAILTQIFAQIADNIFTRISQ